MYKENTMYIQKIQKIILDREDETRIKNIVFSIIASSENQQEQVEETLELIKEYVNKGFKEANKRTSKESTIPTEKGCVNVCEDEYGDIYSLKSEVKGDFIVDLEIQSSNYLPPSLFKQYATTLITQTLQKLNTLERVY